MTQKKIKIEKKVALLNKNSLVFFAKTLICFFSFFFGFVCLEIYKYLLSEMSESGIKMRSKIMKIANYLTFHEII